MARSTDMLVKQSAKTSAMKATLKTVIDMVKEWRRKEMVESSSMVTGRETISQQAQKSIKIKIGKLDYGFIPCLKATKRL